MGNDKKPDVEAIIAELRCGLDDTTPFAENHPDAERQLKAVLRRANAAVDVLGRCGGSLRGRLCKLLARFALPVVEQQNAHNSAITTALNQISSDQLQQLKDRITALEAEVKTLKNGSRT